MSFFITSTAVSSYVLFGNRGRKNWRVLTTCMAFWCINGIDLSQGSVQPVKMKLKAEIFGTSSKASEKKFKQIQMKKSDALKKQKRMQSRPSLKTQHKSGTLNMNKSQNILKNVSTI